MAGLGLRLGIGVGILSLLLAASGQAQPTANMHGRVMDASDAVVPSATVTLRDSSSGFERIVQTDSDGRYQIAAIPAATYELSVHAVGFRTESVAELVVEVGRSLVRDFRLEIGDMTETVVVGAEAPLIDRTTIAVSHVVVESAVHDMPLNGRHFIDLGLLAPGSLTPPQNGQFATPTRGQGSFAMVTAGGREDAVNFMLNGININNQSFGLLMFYPSLSSIREFKVDNSTFSAEAGRSSAGVVNIATRSGTNTFHGEIFDFVRNDALDARNAFNVTSTRSPFERSQFGGHLGGPLDRGDAFFFVSYEGLRQQQGLDVNSIVPSDAERAAIVSPVVREIAAMIPRANVVDNTGTARFVGFADAPVDSDQWSVDVTHTPRAAGRLHGFFGFQNDTRGEPTLQGNTLPGFGDTRDAHRRVLTLNHALVIGAGLVNEARAGFIHFAIDATPNVLVNPAALGIRNGVDADLGLPQINVAGAFNLGGPAQFAQGRTDRTVIVGNTLSVLRGSHSLRLGGEFRRLHNENYGRDPGSFNFPSVNAFLAGTANAFSITLGERSSRITQDALGLFVQDHYRWRRNLTIELGLRYEWNKTPTEQDNRFVVFDPATVSMRRVGVDLEEIYRQNNRNFEPRLGLVWDPAGDGTTVIRAAYAALVDQPLVNAVINTAGNPPFSVPLSATGAVTLDGAIDSARAAGLAPQTVDHGYRNATVRSWNANLQRQVAANTAGMIGYFGSRGRQLRLSRNINQPIGGVRPFPALSASSPILPGTPLDNILQIESTGRSSYDALWATLNQRPTRGLQFTASYTLSKSLDYNSLSNVPIVVQNGYDLVNSRGLSDFDARHRLAMSAIYDLPFRTPAILAGWQLASVAQFQSGNPFNIVTTSSTITGVANTVRPDVTGPIQIFGTVERWFETSVFRAVNTFGNLGRNVVIGPGFQNVDVSLSKRSHLGGRVRLDLQVDVFNVLNHANLGQPGRIVGSPAFGRITNTRFPAGDAGSSRQLQLAVKVGF